MMVHARSRSRRARPGIALALIAAATSAVAHSGHGLAGDHHWHATDALGYLLAAAAVAAAIWWARKK